MAEISLCFPIYNKVRHLDSLFESYETKTNLSRCEIVLIDNGSNDGSSEKIQQWAKRVGGRVVRFDHVLSINESWSEALRQATSPFAKLCLGDDDCVCDPTPLIQKFCDESIEFVVGRTEVKTNEDGLGVNYYEDVHRFRQRIHPDLTIDQKLESLMDNPPYHNAFGDLNAWIFRREAIPKFLPNAGRTYNTFLSFPDIEIAIRAYLKCRGTFIDEVVGSFTFNDDSPAKRLAQSPMLQAHYWMSQSAMCIELLFESGLLDGVSETKLKKIRESSLLSINQLAFQNVPTIDAEKVAKQIHLEAIAVQPKNMRRKIARWLIKRT